MSRLVPSSSRINFFENETFDKPDPKYLRKQQKIFDEELASAKQNKTFATLSDKVSRVSEAWKHRQIEAEAARERTKGELEAVRVLCEEAGRELKAAEVRSQAVRAMIDNLCVSCRDFPCLLPLAINDQAGSGCIVCNLPVMSSVAFVKNSLRRTS